MPGEGPASTPFPSPALQDVDTGPSPGMTWRGKRVTPDDSVLSKRLLTSHPATFMIVFIYVGNLARGQSSQLRLACGRDRRNVADDPHHSTRRASRYTSHPRQAGRVVASGRLGEA